MMKIGPYLLFLIASVGVLQSCESSKGNDLANAITLSELTAQAYIWNDSMLLSKAAEAKLFCRKHNFDTTYCFMLTMQQHSGYNRFFVWNFELNRTIDSGMVSHGCGDSTWSGTTTALSPVFSNIPDSHTSSLGKYRVGKRDVSQWGVGIKYYLYGLESTNNNALSRQIVFHSWNQISEHATYPVGTPEGWGCPAISNAYFLRIDSLLQQTKDPVLLWMF